MGDTATRRPRQAAGTTDQLLKDGSLVLFRANRADMLVLNPLAALIWDASDGEATEAAIVAGLREHFPAQASLDADVRACLDNLAERGFLTWDGPAGSPDPAG